MHCISVTYRKAPVDVREKFAWSNRQIDRFQSDERVEKSGCGMVILSTCNRSEIYFSSDISMEEMEALVKEYKEIPDDMFDEYTEKFSDEDAERHLFEVTSGLDSMVLGEDEVQRQVKDAYNFAHELGNTGYELNMLFQGALRSSKKIKAETEIKYLPVSVGTLTANYAAEFAEKLGHKAKVLLIGGSGKIGKVVAKDMIDLDVFDMYCTIRKHHIDLDTDAQSDKVTEIDYAERYSLLNDADIIVSATSSPHCTIHAYEFRQNVTDYKARLMIDLAVPRDIEPVVGEIEGVELHDIDFIKNISEENNRKKSEQREHMYEILEGVYQDVKHEMAFNSMLDRHKDVLGSDPSLQKEVYKMKAGNSLESIEKYIVSRGE